MHKGLGRVLIVEDEPDVAAVLHYVLQTEGATEIRIATDGGVGLAVAREMRPDLILCDLMLPLMDGLGLCKALRASDPPVLVPLIFITAAASAFRQQPPEDFGAQGVIKKPFDVNLLGAQIRGLLEKTQGEDLDALLAELAGSLRGG